VETPEQRSSPSLAMASRARSAPWYGAPDWVRAARAIGSAQAVRLGPRSPCDGSVQPAISGDARTSKHESFDHATAAGALAASGARVITSFRVRSNGPVAQVHASTPSGRCDHRAVRPDRSLVRLAHASTPSGRCDHRAVRPARSLMRLARALTPSGRCDHSRLAALANRRATGARIIPSGLLDGAILVLTARSHRGRVGPWSGQGN
jgi:hypothetical protein